MHKPLLLLIISLMAAILPAAAAEEFTVGGLIYTPIDGSTASVTGFDTSISGDLVIPPTVSNDGTDYTVTSIDNAFESCWALKSVTIPASVTSIGEAAFTGCRYLASVTIPESVTSIGGGAFADCKSLVSVTIPNNVTTIGQYAFVDCDALTAVRIGKGVTSIGDAAFQGCAALASVTIPSSVTSIEGYAFYGCNSLASVTIPESVTSIGTEAFGFCSNLDKVVFIGSIFGSVSADTFSCIADGAKFYVPVGTEGDYAENLGEGAAIIGYVDGDNNRDFLFEELADNQGYQVKRNRDDLSGDIVIPSAVLLTKDGVDELYPVTKIRHYAFERCTALTSVTIPEGVKSIGDAAFLSCIGLESVTIPESVTSIGSHTFQWCKKLVSVTIPDNVTSIDNNVFYGCSGLASITIPDNVTSIGAQAFVNCDALTSVMIGKGVTSIGAQAFGNCKKLDKVVFTGDISGILTSATFSGIASGAKFYVPKGTEEAYAAALGKSVETIPLASDYGYLTFTPIEGTNDCKVAKHTGDMPADLKIPDMVLLADGVYTVTQIADNAFSVCAELTSVTIPDGVTSIGNGAFSGCSSLASVTIPESVTSISDFAFQYCESLGSVTIPKGVTSIGYSVFIGCTGLGSVTIPEGVTSIGSNAFYDCTSLASVSIPNGVTSIGSDAFYGCTSLASVSIPDGVTSIGSSAFQGCNVLASVSIPDGITSIGRSVFANCSSLASVIIPKSVTTIDRTAFANCSSLASVIIPMSVTTIGSNAFQGCNVLASVLIPDGVTSIGSSAFINCSSLASVIIPASAEIGSMAFEGCGTQAQDPVQVVMLKERPLDNIGEIGLPGEATVYVANAEAVLAYAGKLSGKVASIKPILAVTAEPEKEYYKVSKPMDAPDVAMASVYQPETVWSAEPLADGTANGAVEEDGKLVVTGHGDVTFRVSDVNNPQVYATYSVKGYLQGDANYDGRVTVTDAANVASHIVDLDVTGYFELGADANEDKSVDIADVTTIVDIVLDTEYAGGIQPGGNSRAGGVVEALVRPGAVDVAPDGIACGELTAVQADVVLAPGARIRGVVRGDCLSDGHSIAWREHDGGRVRVIVYSLAAAALRDGSSLFTIEVDGEAGVTTVDNIFASTTGGEETVLGYGGHVTGIAVPVADDEPGTLYDLGGRVVARGVRISEIPSETPRGVYIFRNSKGATKLMHE